MITLDEYNDFDPHDLWVSIFIPKSPDMKAPRFSTIYKNYEKYEDLIIKMPYAQIPYGMSSWKIDGIDNPLGKRTLTLSLSPLVGQRKKFKTFINKIETYLKNRLSPLLPKDYIFKYSIKYDKESKFKHKLTVGLPKNKYGTNNFMIFDVNKNPCSIDEIKAGLRCLPSIILSSAWVNDIKKEFGICWNIFQIKLFPKIVIDYLLHDDLEHGSDIKMNVKDIEKKKEKYNMKCPQCAHKIELTININITGSIPSVSHYIPGKKYSNNLDDVIPAPPPLTPNSDQLDQIIIPRYAPKMEELQNALKKLKKLKK